MSNTALASTGRFSSQLLTNLGTQRTVRTVQGSVANTFKYATTTAVFSDPSFITNLILADNVVVGSCAPTVFDRTRCFFLSRGATTAYADVMTTLTVDMSAMLGVSTVELLEKSEVSGKLDFSANAYYEFNKLRDPGHQVSMSSAIDNRKSLQARQIRA